MKIFVWTLSLGLLVANAAIAAETCNPTPTCAETQTCGNAAQCGRCGRHCGCEKYCKIVCEMKEVKKTVWVVKCSEFCTVMPNCPHKDCGCGACANCQSCNAEPACGCDCGKNCDPCAAEKNKNYIPPKCGKIREKKTLEKKEVVCKVPVYKCVVVYCCPECSGGEGASPSATPPAKPETPAPAPSKTTSDAPMPPALNVSYEK